VSSLRFWEWACAQQGWPLPRHSAGGLQPGRELGEAYVYYMQRMQARWLIRFVLARCWECLAGSRLWRHAQGLGAQAQRA